MISSPTSKKTILGKRVSIRRAGVGSDGIVPATFDLRSDNGKARICCFYEWQAVNEAKRLIQTGRL